MQTTAYLYRPVLKKAWDATKKFKNLWLFGLFAVLTSAGGEYEIITRGLYDPTSEGIIGAFISSFQAGWQEGLSLTSGNFWANLGQLLSSNYGDLALVLFVILFIVVVTLVIIWLIITCEIALIKGASLAVKNKKTSWPESLAFANRNFWPILLIIAVFKIIAALLFWVLGTELWLMSGSGFWGITLYLLSFVIFTTAILFVSLIFKYQRFYILLRKQKLLPSFQSAWELFKKNWLISIEMAVLMLGVYLTATLLLLLIVVILAGIPIIIVPLYLTSVPVFLKVALSILAAILALVSVLLISSILTVFQWAGWVALFERLDDGDGTSKFLRVAEQIRNAPQMIMNKPQI
jgi:hypothetical protein